MMTYLRSSRLQKGGAFNDLKFGNERVYVPGTRWVKPNTPCSPGFLPVMMELHETELTSGMELRILVKVPEPASSAKFGMTPDPANSLIVEYGTPSIPNRTVLPSLVMSVHHLWGGQGNPRI
jgi:hypothetical protein